MAGHFHLNRPLLRTFNQRLQIAFPELAGGKATWRFLLWLKRILRAYVDTDPRHKDKSFHLVDIRPSFDIRPYTALS